MERRGFLKGLAALVGGVALEQAIPLGRVWSFPKEIKCVNVATADIGQYVSYWFATVAKTLDSAPFRYQIIGSVPHPSVIDESMYQYQIKVVTAA